ncbi:MAG TPA: hypothetical protein VFX31_01520 [Ktedonobacterales bacterium]|nr:hypothetical protein [Ktedonobacterales bacterium]HEX5570035.1 hypothetical protein [Ktedonobacterales bacterium]
MSRIISPRRAAARRRGLAPAGLVAGGLGAGFPFEMRPASGVEISRDSWAMSLAMSQAQPSPPRFSQHPSPARASADFTAQVMARLSTPPPEPDPRESRTRTMRAHVRRLAGVYLSLVLVGGVGVALLAVLAPWALVGLAAAIVSLALVALAFAAFIGRLTGGAISGFGVAYLAMLATLSSSLLLLARRFGRRPSHSASAADKRLLRP